MPDSNTKPLKIAPSSPCPCQISTNIAYSACCQPYIENASLPKTAEQLMRSRYSAYVLEDEPYLLTSWHPDFRPRTIEFDHNSKWLGLKIISCDKGKKTDTEGWVHFKARYKVAGKAHRLDEHSYFKCTSDQNTISNNKLAQWQYVAEKDDIRLSSLGS